MGEVQKEFEKWLIYWVFDLTFLQLYSSNVQLPHNKQMKSDAAKAAPLL